MGRMTRSLPCRLTDAELDERQDRLVSLLTEIDDLEAQKKEVSAELAGQIKTAKATLKGTAREIRERSTKRDVECVEIKNDTTFTVEWRRKDNNEVVEIRKMTEDEIARAKQGKLPLDGKPQLVKPLAADGGGPDKPALDLASDPPEPPTRAAKASKPSA